uniref:post-GPI attachment to proteins factor 3-like n=1 Tax=Styela clava TaxID=7725 RepID=UPI001939BDFC|nr:post-GPI attachment to proteins factor 3-like [Styela clava]
MVSVGGCFVSVFLVFVLSVLGVNASFGDRSTIYRSCCETCIRKDCIGPQKLKIFQKNQPLPEKLLFWSCEDECRISLGVPYPDQTNGKTLVRIAAALILVLFFIYHVSYLTYKTFDYGYNMFVNVVIGLTNGAAWIFYHWLTRKTFSHQWKASFIVVYTSCLLAFELLDFVPLWWTFDAHCLWHLGTVIFPFFWYSFLIDECSIFEDKSNTKTA